MKTRKELLTSIDPNTLVIYLKSTLKDNSNKNTMSLTEISLCKGVADSLKYSKDPETPHSDNCTIFFYGYKGGEKLCGSCKHHILTLGKIGKPPLKKRLTVKPKAV